MSKKESGRGPHGKVSFSLITQRQFPNEGHYNHSEKKESWRKRKVAQREINNS